MNTQASGSACMMVSVSLRCRWTSPLRAWKQSLRPAIPFPSNMQQSDWAGLDQRQHKPFRLWLRRSRLSISAGRPSRRWERSGLRHELRYLRSWHSRMKLWLAFTQRTRCPKSEAIDGPWTRARDFRFCEGLRMPAIDVVPGAGPASGSLQRTNPRDGERGSRSMGI